MDVIKQQVQETPLEAESRKAANFGDVEAKLGRRWSISDMPMVEMVTSKLISMPLVTGADQQSRPYWIPQPLEERSQRKRQSSLAS